MADQIPSPFGGEAEPESLDSGIAQLFGSEARPDTPDPYQDHDALLKFYEDFRKECLQDRQMYEREWWKKLMYLIGRQWIMFDKKRGQWTDKRLTRWTPRPVTNFIAETVETIRSVFGQVQLGALARPDGQDPKNVAAAQLADDLEPCLKVEHDIKAKTREGDFWLASLNNVFYYVWWDKHSNRNGMVVLPKEQCQNCGTEVLSSILEENPICPQCGGSDFLPTEGEYGPHIGRGQTDVVSPFELLVPPTITRFSDVPGVIRQRWRTKRWWQDHHPEFSKTLTFTGDPAEKSLKSFKNLATQTDVSSGESLGLSGGGDEAGEGLAEYELWYKPCQKYPEGLFLRVAGETGPKLVVDNDEGSPGPLPHVTPQGSRLWPWIHEQFSQFGGRFWGRGPTDLIMQKQDQINQLDSLMMLIVLRMANPIWLKPKGAEVQSFTGQPGLVVEWNPLAAGGNAKPERIPGEQIPSSLMSMRERLVDDIEQLSGTYDVLKGNKPAGVGAFSALQLLVERSQSRFGGVLEERGEGYRVWFSIALELERLYGPPERIWSLLGPNREWTFQHFQNADLQGAVEIIVEDGSHIPKTNLGMRAAIEQANGLGMINKENVDQVYSIFKDFGLLHLIPGQDANVTSAQQEQDAFETWVNEGQQGPNPMQVKHWHRDPVHLSEHEKWANGDTVRQIIQDHPEPGPSGKILEDVIKMHFEAHEMSAIIKEMPPAQRANIMSQQNGGQNIAEGTPGQQPTAPGAAGGAQALGSSNANSAPLPTPQAMPAGGGAM